MDGPANVVAARLLVAGALFVEIEPLLVAVTAAVVLLCTADSFFAAMAFA